MANYNFDYMTRCEICSELIRFDNPFLIHYDRVCKDKSCVKKYMELTMASNEKLGSLAMKFRGTKDTNVRNSISQEYATAVRHLIVSGSWKELPAFEDQLPDEYMPKEFWKYWKIK